MVGRSDFASRTYLSLLVSVMAAAFFAAPGAAAFPTLWPKGKAAEEKSVEEKPTANTDAGSSADSDFAKEGDVEAGKDIRSTKDDKSGARDKSAVDRVEVDKVDPQNDTESTPNIAVPLQFAPTAVNGANAAGASGQPVDPMAIYREAGVTLTEERKIRQAASEFEGMQRVRLKLLSNLVAEMRELELQPVPDEKTVMAKQDEINKLSATMANERIKLLLTIRDIMSIDEKQRLVEALQRGSGANYSKSGVKPQN